MHWKIQLYSGGEVFIERVIASNRKEAVDTAVSRNPHARVVGANPEVGK